MGFHHGERSGKANQPGARTKAWPVKWLALSFLLGLFLWSLMSPRLPKLAVQATLKRSSSAIAVTADGAFCLAVNPDSNSLSIVDTHRHPSAAGPAERQVAVPHQRRLRWSGEWDESPDSEFANRKENFGSGLIDGEMNCSLSPSDCVNLPPNQGRSYDLDCLALFIDSLLPPPSPGPPSEATLRGQAIFNQADIGCATCHPAPLYTDQQSHDVGTATSDERIGPVYDTPTLRGLYDSAPYFHDGSAATLYDALIRPSPGNEHDVSGLLSEAETQDLIAFLLALPIAE